MRWDCAARACASSRAATSSRTLASSASLRLLSSASLLASAASALLRAGMNKAQQMCWNRATVQSFLDVRTAVLNGTLEDAFLRHYPGFRLAAHDQMLPAAA